MKPGLFLSIALLLLTLWLGSLVMFHLGSVLVHLLLLVAVLFLAAHLVRDTSAI
jgi:hypothetical protein